MTDQVVIDYTNALAAQVGDHGISPSELDQAAAAAGAIHADLVQKRESGEMGFFDLPYQNLTKIIQFCSACAVDLENVVVLGIGGSSLGARALGRALLPPYHEFMDSKGREGRCRLIVADNIDPAWFMGMLSALDLSRSLFIVISKSGATAETMSQFLIVRELLIKKFGMKGYRDRMIAITDKDEGLLRKIVDQDELKWLPVPGNVGGRYSVFTPVGLLPAALCGIDAVSLLKGAASVDRRLREADFFDNPAYLLGALFYLADVKHQKNVLVMMPYSSQLLDLAEWFQQLWAESLGKAVQVDGSPAHCGSTPVRALGATDQHSQLQLYQEGPNDKLIAFLRVEEFKEEAPIPSAFEELEGVSYLAGHSLAELINLEQRATEMALTKAGRPNLRIEFPRITGETMGQVMYLLEMATVFAGGLYRVNPLDQPGVELGKRYTFAMMGRKGFEKEAQEIKAFEQSVKRSRV